MMDKVIRTIISDKPRTFNYPINWIEEPQVEAFNNGMQMDI